MIFISSPGCPEAVIKAAETELVLRTSAKNQKPRETAESDKEEELKAGKSGRMQET
ncbi:unnamed protein product, partial [Rangifer tarandus platyrhynchus]